MSFSGYGSDCLFAKTCRCNCPSKSLTGLRLVINAVKRKENITVKTRTSIIKHEEYALHPHSELNVLMKDYLRKLGNLRKEGKLNDKLQSDVKAEYEKQKREIRKRLNEQFPYKFVDEEDTPEPQPEPDQPKPDIGKVFYHVHQLLMNDGFLEDYFMLFGKRKDRILIEIPGCCRAKCNNSRHSNASPYRIRHS